MMQTTLTRPRNGAPAQADSGPVPAEFQQALTRLKRRFGPQAIMRLGDQTPEAPHRPAVISTGFLSLDLALGVGGLPRGRVSEIYGPEMSGKTTFGYHLLARAQQAGGLAALIDTEHALEPGYAAQCGVDLDNLYVAQPDAAEQALEIVEGLVQGQATLIVVDSVAALVPRAELEGEMGDAHVGLQSRLMSQALRKLVGLVREKQTALLFTNQLRYRPGVLFGNPETTTGGVALRYYASVRLEVRRIQAVKEGGAVIGQRVRVVVKKNKVAPPFRECEVDLFFAGLSPQGDLLALALKQGLVTKRGGAYTYAGQPLGEGGRQGALRFLAAQPEVAGELERTLREQAGLPPAGEPPLQETKTETGSKERFDDDQ